MAPDSAPLGESLEGRTAIVTGGSRGIGRAIAERLGNAGARVVVVARSEVAAQRVAAEIMGRGGEALVVTCDVRIASDVERLVERTLETFERVDIVVNNAGISPVRVEPQEIGEANWDAILDTNLKGTFLLSTTAATYMLSRGNGVIINIASIAGVTPIPLESAYCASKAGMIGLTKALARGLGALWHPSLRSGAGLHRDGDERRRAPDRRSADSSWNRRGNPWTLHSGGICRFHVLRRRGQDAPGQVRPAGGGGGGRRVPRVGPRRVYDRVGHVRRRRLDYRRWR